MILLSREYYIKIIEKLKYTIILALVLTLYLSGCKASWNYAWVLEANWKITLPDGFHEIYEKDTGPSFHGDGTRYHVLQYDNIQSVKDHFQWTEQTGQLEDKIIEWLDKLDIMDDNKPDLDTCQYYYEKKSSTDEIIILFNWELKRLYIMESFS